MLTVACRALATLVPADARPSAGDDLGRALTFLDSDLAPETVVAAGYAVGGLVALLAVPAVFFVPGQFRVAALPVALALALGAVHGVHRAPVLAAALRRTAALGDVPDLVGRAVLRMRVEPTPESAAAFAGKTGDGTLAASLATHVRAARGTPRTGLAAFADEWAEWFPTLDRSTNLLAAAGAVPTGERGRTLDRALSAALDGTRERMATFAGDVRAPTTGLYAFGVLLPTALVAVLPAAGVAGVPVSFPVVVAVYDVLLPLVLVAASGWLLLRRPVAFPPPAVDRSHPDVPATPWRPVAAAAGAGALAVVATLPLPAWTTPVAVVGATAGAGLVAWYQPVTEVRDRVRAVEDGLPDALSLVGRRVTEGEAVETAIERAGGELSGATGEVLAGAARRGRQLQVGVEAAFLGEHGALADLPSPRARGAASLLGLAAREGQPAGDAIVAMASHLSDLRDVEREARQELSSITGTLRSTAALFGPLVAGATVALSGNIRAGSDGGPGGGAAVGGGGTGSGALPAGGSDAGDAAGALPPDQLGLAVGAYVLLMAVLLTALATGLERGLDRPLVGYRVGRALCLATPCFLLAVVGTGLVV